MAETEHGETCYITGEESAVSILWAHALTDRGKVKGIGDQCGCCTPPGGSDRQLLPGRPPRRLVGVDYPLRRLCLLRRVGSPALSPGRPVPVRRQSFSGK